MMKSLKMICVVYHQLFEENFNIKKVDKVVLKKINELELEKKRLISNLQESTKSLSD